MHIQKISKPGSLSFVVYTHRFLRIISVIFLVLTWLDFSVALAQTTNYSLGLSNLLVGSLSGINSVVLAVTPATGSWTATTNAAWLHLTAANQSGTGSTNVVFQYDANSGATRSGTLTIAGQTLTVTQAASTYVAATAVITLVSSGLSYPSGVAVDSAGNVYIADTDNNAIKEWTASNNAVSTLVSSGLSGPSGVAVDAEGNVYIADTTNNAIKEWTVANSNLTTLVSTGLSYPQGLALDDAGNIYIADTGDSQIKEWTVANSNLTTLVPMQAHSVAVDGAGNIYAAGGNIITEFTVANRNSPKLLLNVVSPYGVAVDGAGNVYDSEFNAIRKLTVASKLPITMVPGLIQPSGVAVDGAGNVYFSDIANQAIKEVPYAFVDSTPKLESMAAGNDALPVVLPATANLQAQFAPTSDEPWLTVTGITNDVVSFAFTATTSSRTGYLTVLGQLVPVMQGVPNFSLGATALLEGPATGSDSVVLAVLLPNSSWTNTANANWLHLNSANQSGVGSTNVVFNFDANPGATRSGTLTIAGQTLSVTQAGSTYVPVGTVTALVPGGLYNPTAAAVDGAGNVYFADLVSKGIVEWMPASDTLSLVVSGVSYPVGVQVDGAGNVYIADYSTGILEWTAADSSLSTLVSSGVQTYTGLAVDGAGNVYLPDDSLDGGPVGIVKWTAADDTLSQLNNLGAISVALDIAGNVYFTSTLNGLAEWIAAKSTVIDLHHGAQTFSLEVDGSGNVYLVNFNTLMKWTAADNTYVPLLSSTLSAPTGVAVDSMDNVYITDFESNTLVELPHAFVDPTPRLEGLAAGNDALPMVLPSAANLLPPFSPTSDQSWLTITGITNGVVSFSFTDNTTGPSRTANITLLGQTIPITQGTIGTPPTLIGVQWLGGGVLQFGFTNSQSASLTVLSTTNLALPLSNWTVVGTATNMAPGQFQFTSQPTTNDQQRFYRVRSP